MGSQAWCQEARLEREQTSAERRWNCHGVLGLLGPLWAFVKYPSKVGGREVPSSGQALGSWGHAHRRVRCSFTHPPSPSAVPGELQRGPGNSPCCPQAPLQSRTAGRHRGLGLSWAMLWEGTELLYLPTEQHPGPARSLSSCERAGPGAGEVRWKTQYGSMQWLCCPTAVLAQQCGDALGQQHPGGVPFWGRHF